MKSFYRIYGGGSRLLPGGRREQKWKRERQSRGLHLKFTHRTIQILTMPYFLTHINQKVFLKIFKIIIKKNNKNCLGHRRPNQTELIFGRLFSVSGRRPAYLFSLFLLFPLHPLAFSLISIQVQVI